MFSDGKRVGPYFPGGGCCRTELAGAGLPCAKLWHKQTKSLWGGKNGASSPFSLRSEVREAGRRGEGGGHLMDIAKVAWPAGLCCSSHS